MAIKINEVGKYCRDCTDRQMGCHSTCEKYKAAKDQYEILHEEISKQKRINSENRTYIRNRMDSIRRSHGKH